METDGLMGHPINKDEAATSLNAAASSRAKAIRADYPAWFWLGTGVGMAGLPASSMLPQWWSLLGAFAAVMLVIATTIALPRVRRLRELKPAAPAVVWFWLARPLGPALAAMFLGAVLSRWLWWAPLATAGLVFIIWVGTGLLATTRPAR